LRSLRIGHHVVPLWLIAVMLTSVFGSGLAYYVWKTLTIPIEVKEPIEVLYYPTQLSLYPGETKDFNITVQNHASINYSVALNFHLSNSSYQTYYVTFSDQTYTVVNGQQNLTASLKVSADAPIVNTELSIDFSRIVYPSTEGLIAYWKFDEGSGTAVLDSSGKGNNGTLYGATWVTGKSGDALSFDGTDDYVAIPDLYSTSPAELTVSAWINYSPTTGFLDIIHQCRNGEFSMCLPYSGVLSFGAKLADPYSGISSDARWNLSANAWYHVVGTWKKGDSTRLYINGVLVNQTAVPDAYMFNAYWLDAAIGCRYRTECFFNGTIDQVMVFSRAFNATEVLALYLNPLL